MLAFLVLACTSGGVAVADHEDSADTAASADSAEKKTRSPARLASIVTALRTSSIRPMSRSSKAFLRTGSSDNRWKHAAPPWYPTCAIDNAWRKLWQLSNAPRYWPRTETMRK